VNSQEHPIRPLLAVYAVLMILLMTTAAASVLPSGWWSTPISLSIAVAKASLVFCFFMRLRFQPSLVRIFALAGFFWLAILIVLTLADFLTRAWPV
jgi:cytochrome c oxidase subunit IV